MIQGSTGIPSPAVGNESVGGTQQQPAKLAPNLESLATGGSSNEGLLQPSNQSAPIQQAQDASTAVLKDILVVQQKSLFT